MEVSTTVHHTPVQQSRHTGSGIIKEMCFEIEGWISSISIVTLQMPLMHISRLLLPPEQGVPSVTASRIFSEKCSFSGRQCSSQRLTECGRRGATCRRHKGDNREHKMFLRMTARTLKPVDWNLFAHLC